MYCTFCLKIIKKNHFKTKKHKSNEKIENDILLNVVGGEIGLVQKILDYKKDLEIQYKVIKCERMLHLQHFRELKKYKLTNLFNNKLKITFRQYHCYVSLDKIISLYDLTYNQLQFLETLDLALMKFICREPKTNERFEKCIKKQIVIWNRCHFNEEFEEILLFSRHNEIRLT